MLDPLEPFSFGSFSSHQSFDPLDEQDGEITKLKWYCWSTLTSGTGPQRALSIQAIHLTSFEISRNVISQKSKNISRKIREKSFFWIVFPDQISKAITQLPIIQIREFFFYPQICMHSTNTLFYQDSYIDWFFWVAVFCQINHKFSYPIILLIRFFEI